MSSRKIKCVKCGAEKDVDAYATSMRGVRVCRACHTLSVERHRLKRKLRTVARAEERIVREGGKIWY